MRFVSFVAALIVGLGAATVAQAQPKTDPANTLILELKSGKVTIELLPDLAPKHVERVKMLAKEGFYNGIKLHRVIAGFMAQTGDPTGTGTAARSTAICRPNSRRRRSSAASSARPAPTTRTAPTASSSSVRRERRTSTASTRSGARWSMA